MSAHKRPSDRVFGYTFGVVFAMITTVAWFVFDTFAVWAVAVSATFLVLASVVPGVLMPLNRLWSSITPKIAVVTNAIVLSAAYCLVVIPIGLAMRLVRRDALLRTPRPEQASYWIAVKRQSSRDTYRDLF